MSIRKRNMHIKLLLQLLFLSCLTSSDAWPRLYNTDNRFAKESSLTGLIEYDCMYTTTTLTLNRDVFSISPYCIRLLENEMDNEEQPTISSNLNTINFVSTFSILRLLNATKDLLLASISLDLLERYLIYENDNETIYFCEAGWFGVFCEYSFDNEDFVDGRLSFDEIIQRRFRLKRIEYINSIDVLIQTNSTVPCYMGLKDKCQRPIELCLDWREICDGKNLFVILILKLSFELYVR